MTGYSCSVTGIISVSILFTCAGRGALPPSSCLPRLPVAPALAAGKPAQPASPAGEAKSLFCSSECQFSRCWAEHLSWLEVRVGSPVGPGGCGERGTTGPSCLCWTSSSVRPLSEVTAWVMDTASCVMCGFLKIRPASQANNDVRSGSFKQSIRQQRNVHFGLEYNTSAKTRTFWFRIHIPFVGIIKDSVHAYSTSCCYL